jgi:hypothetical protein
LPAIEEWDFYKFSDEFLALSRKVLTILELTEWHWTIKDVLEQDEQLLNAVMTHKDFGEKVRTKNRSAKNSETEVI